MAEKQVEAHEKMNFVALIFGAKGYGKSKSVKTALQKKLPLFRRVVIIDIEEEYNQNHHVEYRSYTRSDFIKIAKNVWNKDESFVIAHTSEEDDQEIFDILFDLQGVSEKPLTLIVDEAHHWGKSDKDLAKILRRGRHRRISTILITHRPPDLDPMFRLQADMIISFRQTQKIDIEAFRHFMDEPERLMKLKRDQHIIVARNDTKDLNF